MEGGNFGVIAAILIAFIIGIYALIFATQIAVGWSILRKFGKPGGHVLIPVYNMYELYDCCWSGVIGIVWSLLYVVTELTIADVIPVDTKMMAALQLACFAAVASVAVIWSIRMARRITSGGKAVLCAAGLIVLHMIGAGTVNGLTSFIETL